MNTHTVIQTITITLKLLQIKMCLKKNHMLKPSDPYMHQRALQTLIRVI